MDIEAVAPELRPALTKTPFPDVTKPTALWLVRNVSAHMPGTATPGVDITTRRDGGARVRVHRPQLRRTDAALLWVHGGGMILGSPQQDDPLVGGTASELGMVVVAARYRVAPKGRFPGALDDVIAAWDWLQTHADELGVDPARVAIGGESAGGGLAASAAQLLHDRGGHPPIAQWLFAPMLDDRTAADRTLDAVEHPVWTNRANRVGWSRYLGQEPGLAEVPAYAVPARREHLAGLPPAWICAGDIELFHAEDAAYAERLAAAGVETTFDVIPGGAHGFENWARDTPITRELLGRARDWLAARIGVERG